MKIHRKAIAKAKLKGKRELAALGVKRGKEKYLYKNPFFATTRHP